MRSKIVSLIVSALILTGMLSFASDIRPVRANGPVYSGLVYNANGPIYILANGTVSPSSAPILKNGSDYTLTGNITSFVDGIIIQKSNVTINGAGHTLRRESFPPPFGGVVVSHHGFNLTGVNFVTIKNTTITNFTYGIYLSSSSNNTLFDNNVANNPYGIWLESSSNNTISGNNVTNNNGNGIYLDHSDYCRIVGNAFVNDGLTVTSSFGNVVSGNLVNGKPLVYFEDASDRVVTNAGQVVLVNCNRMTVENLNLSHTDIGVELWNTNNTIISGNNITSNNEQGIWLASSSGNTVSGNNITANIFDAGIELESSSNNNTVSGNSVTNNYYGILLSSSLYNIFSGNSIASNNAYGIYLYFSSNNIVSDNNIANNGEGILLISSSSYNAVSGNNVTSDYWHGIWLASSSNNIVSDNNITNSQHGIALESSSNSSVVGNVLVNDGLTVTSSFGNVVSGNLVNGKPLVYFEDASDRVVTNAGQVVLVNCNRMTVENLNLSHTDIGVELWNTNNTIISGNNITSNSEQGIWLESASNCTVSGNSVTSNWDGMDLYYSSGNTVSGNSIANDTWGLQLESSSDNTVSGNSIANDTWGLQLESSSNNTVSGNDIANCFYYGISLYSSSNNTAPGNDMTNSHYYGIFLEFSSNNTVSDNNIANNNYFGIYLYLSSGNIIYHNNFVSNTMQAGAGGSVNAWDDGYPSGGNYWSNYTGTDLFSGPSQNQPGSDGIGDTPYPIAANNTDHYPLMAPFHTFTAGTWNGATYNVNIVSNSTITDFNFSARGNVTPQLPFIINFTVKSTNGATGFCRVTIPKQLTSVATGGWAIEVNAKLVLGYINKTNGYTYIYFTYLQGTETVQLVSPKPVPELQPFMLLPLFMIMTLLGAIVLKRKRNATTNVASGRSF